MGNPIIWFWPVSGGSAIEIELPACLADIQTFPITDRPTAQALNGRIVSTLNTAGLGVTITYGPFNDSGINLDLWRKLTALESHLTRGGVCSITADRDKAYLSKVNTPLSQGETSFSGTDNFFKDFWGGSGAIAAGDWLTLESELPNYSREQLEVSTWSTTGATSTTKQTVFSYSGTTWARHSDFYPVLRMPESEINTPILVSQNRIIFELQVTLVLDIEGIVAILETQQALTPVQSVKTIAPGLAGLSLDDIVNARPGGDSGSGSRLALTVGLPSSLGGI